MLITFITHIRSVFRDYSKKDGFNLAAALSFYVLFSLLPLTLIALSIVTHYFGSGIILTVQLDNMVESLIPLDVKNQIISMVQSAITNKSTFGGFGILLLVAAVYFMFVNLDRTVNRLLDQHEKRHFLMTRLVFVLWMACMILLLIVPQIILSAQHFLDTWNLSFKFQHFFTGRLWFLTMCWLSFVLAMQLLPNKRITFLKAAAWGFVFAGSLALVQWGFKLYVMRAFDRYNVIYGSLTVVIMIALWIYYSCNVFLICVVGAGRGDQKDHPG